LKKITNKSTTVQIGIDRKSKNRMVSVREEMKERERQL
jgi:hypothetical protein